MTGAPHRAVDAASRGRARRSAHPHRGFTLIEAMCTVVILAIISGAATTAILVAVDGYVETTTRAQLHNELSIAMDRIVRELRAIPADTSVSPAVPDIVTTGADFVTWNTSYYVAHNGSNEVTMFDGTGAVRLLRDVPTVVMKFYDESNTEIGPSLTGAACDPIRRIEITITQQRNGVSESLRSRVFLRSMVSGSL